MSSRGTSPAKEYLDSHNSGLSDDAASRVDELLAKRRAELAAGNDSAFGSALTDALDERGKNLTKVEAMLHEQNEGAQRLAGHVDELADAESGKGGKKKKAKKDRKKNKKKGRFSGASDTSNDDGAALLSPSPDPTPTKKRGFFSRSSKSPHSERESLASTTPASSPQPPVSISPKGTTPQETSAPKLTAPVRPPLPSPSPGPTERSKLILTRAEEKELGVAPRKKLCGCCTLM
eukprot:m.200380 g.200380  ORF g.200380 m.200380 type:complete len:234 (-) comp21032_c0_seq1:8-709(-)